MEITKIHPITGESNTLDLDVTEEDLQRWKAEKLSVQNVFPHLNSDEREFLISGLLPGEFDKLYPEPEE